MIHNVNQLFNFCCKWWRHYQTGTMVDTARHRGRGRPRNT